MARNQKAHARARRSAAARRSQTKRRSHNRLARALHCERLEDRRLLAVVTVDTIDDSIDFDDGKTSLREAIFATNTVPDADEICFDPALFAYEPATILLTHGELAITDSLSITGPGAELLTIDASGSAPTPDENNSDGSRLFNIDSGRDYAVIEANIDGLTLTGGYTLDDGGAIRSVERLTMDNVHFADNAAYIRGGAIFSSGSLAVLNCRFEAYRAFEGAAVFAIADGEAERAVRVHIANSDFHANDANYRGTILLDTSGDSSARIEQVRVWENQQHSGGAISINSYDDSTVVLHQSEIEMNRARSETGGGVGISGYGNAQLTVSDCTIQDNSAPRGGGASIFVGGAYHVQFVRTEISNNRTFNHAGGEHGGGMAMYLPGAGSIIISECRFSHNYAWSDGARSTLTLPQLTRI